jgi:SAM-dependent methyltransferase
MSERPDNNSIIDVSSGSRDGTYRDFVGPGEKYDIFSAVQFNLLTFLGLREHHFLLDIGCGSLRTGRLFIPYLLPGHYFGIEPENWLLTEGISNETGEDLIRLRKPSFSNDSNFTLSVFDRKFDFILAHSIFSHATQEQIRRCLSEAKKVMTPESVFAATFVEGEENYTGDKWTLWAKYTFEHMNSLVEEQGLVCRPFGWPSVDMQKWILIVTPDCKFNIPSSDSGMELMKLRSELNFCTDRLNKIENHPLIKIALGAKRFLRLLDFVKYRFRK